MYIDGAAEAPNTDEGNMRIPMLPASLYDAADSVTFGTARATGNLMRLRVENLVARPDGELGLRRATHAAAMIVVTINVYERPQGRTEKGGFFSKELENQIAERLRTAHLQSAESRFRDIFAWRDLDRAQVRLELYSNLGRLLKDEPTECLMIGIELHVLLEMHMRYRFTDYERVFYEKKYAIYPQLGVSSDRLNRALAKRAA
ncbi:MAG TPA: hypothetical protein VJH91_00630 [Candidatus Paceibacterota bacterium]